MESFNSIISYHSRGTEDERLIKTVKQTNTLSGEGKRKLNFCQKCGPTSQPPHKNYTRQTSEMKSMCL